jgi:hypothetical protein
MSEFAAVQFAGTEPKPGEPITIRIDRIPLSLNFWTRKHWVVRARDGRDMKMHVNIAFGVKRRQWVALHGPWFSVPVQVHLVYYVGVLDKNGRKKSGFAARLDVDNLVPKHILDALTGLAYKDDNIDCVPMVTTEARRTDGKGGRTVITIAPYDASW